MSAGARAFDLQKFDDDRAENVAAIFIEDALREDGVSPDNAKAFAAAEREADRLWTQFRARKASR